MIIRIVGTALLFFFSASAMGSTKVFLGHTYASGPNAIEDLSEIVDDLISQDVRDYEEIEITNREQEANLKFFPKLISTNSVYILSVKVVNLSEGGSFNEYSYLNSISELNDAVPELVDKIFAKMDTTADLPQKSKVQLQQNAGVRRNADSFWYFGMGTANPNGVKYRQSMSQWTLGYAWSYNRQILRLELESASTQNSEDYYMSGWGFTGMHMLTEGKTSLFVSGTLQNGGFHYLDTLANEQDVNAFILGTGIGYLFWTNSLNIVEVSLYYRGLLAKVDGSNPNITGLKVGIFW